MKKSLLSLFAALSVGLILLSVAVPVNHSSALPTWNNTTLQAEGTPLPPPIIPHAVNTVLVAEGTPLPPPIIPHAVNTVLVAEGTPLPPPIIPHVVNPVLV